MAALLLAIFELAAAGRTEITKTDILGRAKNYWSNSIETSQTCTLLTLAAAGSSMFAAELDCGSRSPARIPTSQVYSEEGPGMAGSGPGAGLKLKTTTVPLSPEMGRPAKGVRNLETVDRGEWGEGSRCTENAWPA